MQKINRLSNILVIFIFLSIFKNSYNADIINNFTYSVDSKCLNIEEINDEDKAIKNNFIKPENDERIIIQRTIVSRGTSLDICITDRLLNTLTPLKMKATAYDLSIESCGKPRHHPLYGITASGTKAKPNRTVAVDPKIIPLGSILYIEFPEEYNHMNGLYVAEDTGSAIKGNKIDIFFGEDKPGERKIYNECLKFGVKEVTVYIVNHKN